LANSQSFNNIDIEFSSEPVLNEKMWIKGKGGEKIYHLQ
jgi:hypothetical protein